MEAEKLEDCLAKADVVYMTRIQKERFPSKKFSERIQNSFLLRMRHIDALSGQAIIMHPLPRNHEIHPEIDFDPRAAYFKQAQNGLYLRMALLKMILS